MSAVSGVAALVLGGAARLARHRRVNTITVNLTLSRVRGPGTSYFQEGSIPMTCALKPVCHLLYSSNLRRSSGSRVKTRRRVTLRYSAFADLRHVALTAKSLNKNKCACDVAFLTVVLLLLSTPTIWATFSLSLLINRLTTTLLAPVYHGFLA